MKKLLSILCMSLLLAAVTTSCEEDENAIDVSEIEKNPFKIEIKASDITPYSFNLSLSYTGMLVGYFNDKYVFITTDKADLDHDKFTYANLNSNEKGLRYSFLIYSYQDSQTVGSYVPMNASSNDPVSFEPGTTYYVMAATRIESSWYNDDNDRYDQNRSTLAFSNILEITMPELDFSNTKLDLELYQLDNYSADFSYNFNLDVLDLVFNQSYSVDFMLFGAKDKSILEEFISNPNSNNIISESTFDSYYSFTISLNVKLYPGLKDPNGDAIDFQPGETYYFVLINKEFTARPTIYKQDEEIDLNFKTGQFHSDIVDVTISPDAPTAKEIYFVGAQNEWASPESESLDLFENWRLIETYPGSKVFVGEFFIETDYCDFLFYIKDNETTGHYIGATIDSAYTFNNNSYYTLEDNSKLDFYFENWVTGTMRIIINLNSYEMNLSRL